MMKYIIGLFALAVVRASGYHEDLDLVMFGDSLSDVGNTFQMTQRSYPNSTEYPKHCFSDGYSWLHYYRIDLENRKRKVKLHNYAFGGSTTNASAIAGFTGPSGTWPVAGTSQQFQMFVNSPLSKKKRKTVFQVNVGANDLYFSWAAQEPLTEQLYEEIAHRTVKLVLDIEDYIGNNSDSKIIVSTMYPVNLIPFGKVYLGNYSSIAQKYNRILFRLLDASVNRGKTHVFNFTQVVTHFINSSGLKQTKCPVTVPRNCSDYIFVDSFHPAASLHKVIAKKMTEFTNNVYNT